MDRSTPEKNAGDRMETLRLEGVGKTSITCVPYTTSLTVFSGTRKVILGPNGAGKTTLFNLITGVYKPSAGDIYLFGEDVTSTATHTVEDGAWSHLPGHQPVPFG